MEKDMRDLIYAQLLFNFDFYLNFLKVNIVNNLSLFF